MPNGDIFVIAILVMIVALVVEYFSLSRKNFERKLQKCKEEGDLLKYRDMLDSQQGRRYYKRGKDKLLLFDAALQMGENEEVRALIDELDALPMNSTDFINYNMKKLTYGIQTKDEEIAKSGWQAVHDARIRTYVKREADQLYDIYVLRRDDHITELKEFAKKAKNPSSKAMAYYRIAQQYFNKDDKKHCLQYISMAKDAYSNTTWQKMMEQILKGDFSNLE